MKEYRVAWSLLQAAELAVLCACCISLAAARGPQLLKQSAEAALVEIPRGLQKAELRGRLSAAQRQLLQAETGDEDVAQAPVDGFSGQSKEVIQEGGSFNDKIDDLPNQEEVAAWQIGLTALAALGFVLFGLLFCLRCFQFYNKVADENRQYRENRQQMQVRDELRTENGPVGVGRTRESGPVRVSAWADTEVEAQEDAEPAEAVQVQTPAPPASQPVTAQRSERSPAMALCHVADPCVEALVRKLFSQGARRGSGSGGSRHGTGTDSFICPAQSPGSRQAFGDRITPTRRRNPSIPVHNGLAPYYVWSEAEAEQDDADILSPSAVTARSSDLIVPPIGSADDAQLSKVAADEVPEESFGSQPAAGRLTRSSSGRSDRSCGKPAINVDSIAVDQTEQPVGNMFLVSPPLGHRRATARSSRSLTLDSQTEANTRQHPHLSEHDDGRTRASQADAGGTVTAAACTSTNIADSQGRATEFGMSSAQANFESTSELGGRVVGSGTARKLFLGDEGQD